MNNLEIQDRKIENLIYEIREKQVMLDSDLARLYNCKNGTKVINQAVKRHLDRFPSDFCFQLTYDEMIILKSQSVTSSMNNNYGGVRKLPYVFTEQGVAMLATIIRTDIASQVSISIMRAFVLMRHYIGNNEFRLSNVESKIIEHDNSIKLLQDSFNKFEDKKRENEIFFNGQIYDAYSRILDIFKEAKNEIIIIDNYADNNLLNIISKLNIKVILITTNKFINKEIMDKYKTQYNNLDVIYNNSFHDRYFILDKNKFYHCGTSLNRIGFKTFSINVINDEITYKSLLNNVKGIINS